MFTIIVHGFCFGASVLSDLRTIISYQSTAIISITASFAWLRQMEAENHGAPRAHVSVISHRWMVKKPICIFFLLSRVFVILLITINSSPIFLKTKIAARPNKN
jgi:hypothetical protein